MGCQFKKTWCFVLLVIVGWFTIIHANAQDEASYQQLKEHFASPDYATWGEVPLWWWEGDSLQKERVTWQLETLAAKGVKAVCPIQRSPARSFPESFSDEWWDMASYVHDECKRLGMQLWLYDQVGYGQYGWLEKAAAQVGDTGTSQIEFYSASGSNGGQLQIDLKPGKILDARAYPVIADTARDENSVDLRNFIQNNQLQWTPDGPGEWKVAVSVASPYMSFYMNEASADVFLEQLYQKIEDVVGADAMGSSLAGVFQDEHPPTPRNIYNQELSDTFQTMFGYDIARAIPALHFDVGDKTPKYRNQYFDAYLAMVEKTYWKKVFDWTEEKNVLTSHDNWGRNNIYHHSQGYIDYFRSQRWFSAPGFDDAFTHPLENRNYYDIKIAASIARLYQRPRVWNEGFHSSGWGRTTEQTLSWLATSYAWGANLYNEHGLYYSLNASTWEHAAPDPHYNQPYWEYYHKISDWTARASYLMSQGQAVADAAVHYPVTSLLADMERNEIDYNSYMQLSRIVYDAGIDNDIIDDQSIMEGIIENGRLHIRGNQYQALVFGPQKTMRLPVLEKALALVQNGGVVIFYEQLPTASVENGRNDPQVRVLIEKILGEQIAGMQLQGVSANHPHGGYAAFLPDTEALIPSLISAHIDRDFVSSGGKVFVSHRQTGDNHIYFIQNVDDKPITLNARLRADGVPEVWNAFTGEVKEVDHFERINGYTHIRLLLEGNLGEFVVLNPHKTSLSKKAAVAPRWRTKGISDVWDFSVMPTRDNSWGDFQWPPSNEKLGPEIRQFKYREENGDDGLASGWNLPGFNDSDWEKVTVDIGPYWLVAESIPAETDVIPAVLNDQNRIEAGSGILAEGAIIQWRELAFSKNTGTWRPAPWGGHSGYPDGHYNKNFIQLNEGRKLLFTSIYSPDDQQAGLNVQLRNQEPGLWVNGEQQPFTGNVGNLPLKKGYNDVLLDVPDGTGGMLYVQKQPPAVASPEGALIVQDPGLKDASWIWIGNTEGAYFRKAIDLERLPENARVSVTGVSGFRLFINGVKVTEDIGPWATWKYPKSIDITPWLKEGKNTFAAWGQFFKGMYVSHTPEYQGFILAMKTINSDESTYQLLTDAGWKASIEEVKNWHMPDFDDSAWQQAEVKGKAGDNPWGSDFLKNEGSSTTPYRPLSVNLNTPLLEEFEEMPEIDYDVKQASDERWGWYRFEAPPGLKEMTIPNNEARIWVNGSEIPVKNGLVEIQNPPINVSTVAIRLKMDRGKYAGAAFERPVRLALEGGKIKAGPWQNFALPTYSGIGVYKQTVTFSAEEIYGEVVLDLGEVCVATEVFVNGESAGIKVAAPFKFDILPFIKQGTNDIEVRVANTLAPHYSFPLRALHLGPVKSGLIGPVSLMVR